MEMKSKDDDEGVSKSTRDEGSRPWYDLPMEMLELIVSGLPVTHRPYFFSVCKSWSRLTLPIYPVGKCPLLLHYRKRDCSDICRYYSPLHNKTFLVECPLDLSDCVFFFARNGWLLLYDNFDVILVNPITRVLHEFPGLAHGHCFSGVAFSGTPPNECTIFAIDSIVPDSVKICIYEGGEWCAEGFWHDNNRHFISARSSNPVFFDDGRVYCLGSHGNLGVYDLAQSTWAVLDKPKNFGIRGKEYCFLFESKGQLLSVVTRGKSIHVLRLNRLDMVWEMVYDLRDDSLFIASKTSVVTTISLTESIKNRVYVSRFHGDPEVVSAEFQFFDGQLFLVAKSTTSSSDYLKQDSKKTSESSKMCYYSIKDSEYVPKYSGSEECMYSIWFEPKLVE